MNDANAGFVILIGGVLIVLAILWFFLPFAIFGTKDILEQILKEQKETNSLLKSANESTRSIVENNQP